MPRELTTKMLEELRTQIKSYFEAYYSALRSEIAGHDALYDSIPRHFKGQREVVTNFCRDGVLIVHLPAESGQESYVFESDLDSRVEDAVARYTPTLPSGESATIIDYSPYEDFGTFSLTEPLRQEENGRTYESEWTRMDIASWNNLGMWRDKLQARRLTRNNLTPYLEQSWRPAPGSHGTLLAGGMYPHSWAAQAKIVTYGVHLRLNYWISARPLPES